MGFPSRSPARSCSSTKEVSAAAGQEKTGEIAGKVVAANGRAITGATIVLRRRESTNEEREIQRRILGAEENSFSFEELPAGQYVLRVEAAGFRPAEQELDLTQHGESAAVTVTLEILPVNETIVVSETRSEQQLGDLPAQVTVVLLGGHFAFGSADSR